MLTLTAAIQKAKYYRWADLPYITLGSATPDWGSIAYIQQIVGKTPLQIIALTPETDDNGKIVIRSGLWCT